MTIGPKRKLHLQIAARVRQVYEVHDAEFAKSAAHEPISCKRGCAACCNQMIGSTYPEAVAIYARHAALVDELLPELKEDQRLLSEIGEAAGIPETATLLPAEVRNAFCGAWWRLRRPCTFLDPVTKDCRIYADRPAACRTYHVTNDPYYCGTDEASEVRIVCGNQEAMAHALKWAGGGRATVVMGPLSSMLILARQEMRLGG